MRAATVLHLLCHEIVPENGEAIRRNTVGSHSRGARISIWCIKSGHGLYLEGLRPSAGRPVGRAGLPPSAGRPPAGQARTEDHLLEVEGLRPSARRPHGRPERRPLVLESGLLCNQRIPSGLPKALLLVSLLADRPSCGRRQAFTCARSCPKRRIPCYIRFQLTGMDHWTRAL